MPSIRAGVTGGSLDDRVASLGRSRLALLSGIGFVGIFFALWTAPAAHAALNVNVTVQGTGDGKVEGVDTFSAPIKWNGTETECRKANSPCLGGVANGFKFELTATPDTGSVFAGWTITPKVGLISGCQAGPTCAVTNFAETTYDLTATFLIPPDPPEVEFPAVGLEPVGEITASEASFHGRVNPSGDELTSCRFEYLPQDDPEGFEGSAVKSEPCVPGPGGIGEGEAFVEVEATVVDLAPNTPYDVRLVAKKAGAEPETATGPAPTYEAAPVAFSTEAIPPEVATDKAWSISDTTATLTGTVDANNSPTMFHFEYVDDAEFQANGFANAVSAPFPDGDAGTAGTPLQVTEDISGLQPTTTYHFRIVADNGVEIDPEGDPGNTTAAGSDTTFSTRPAVFFPTRGYELVSAFDTNGIPLVPDLAAAGGDHYAYSSVQLPVPGAENGGTSFFRASRNPDGSWSQRFVGAPTPGTGEPGGGGNSAPLYSAADLSRVAWGTLTAVDPSDENGAQDSYLRDALDGSIAWLSCTPVPPATTCPPSGEEGPGAADQPQYVSPDGGRVLFASSRRLLPEDLATGTNRSLYEWDEGRLSLVGVAPGTDEGFLAGSSLGSVANRRGTGGENAYGNDVAGDAVSRDGSRVAFQSGAGATSQRLYVRLGGEKTVEASAGAPGAPAIAAPKNVNYWGADADLRSVFFSSASPLTADSSAPDTTINVATGAGGSADLYRYVVPADGNPANGQLVDLTPHTGGAGVLQVLSVSEDGRRLYFLANGALTPGAQPGDCRGSDNVVIGACNLYLAELDGPADPVNLTLISHSGITLGRVATGASSTIRASEKLRQAVADPAGSVLAFLSAEALVPGRQSGDHSQVYLYDAARDELSCVSCPDDGSTPPAPASLTTAKFTSNYAPGFNGELHNGVPHMRNVSAAGAAVFFQTASPLVAADANGKRDVYEHRGGKLALISNAGNAEAVFGDATADGSTVFFATSSQILRGIEAGSIRVYAARVGVPDWEPPVPPPPCTGEDCKPVAPGQPNYSAPSTSTVLGRGNLTERRNCARPARQARQLGKQAKRLRGAAARAENPRRIAALRRQARRAARAARKHNQVAKRCRSVNRRMAR